MNKTLTSAALLIAVVGLGLTGCQTAPKGEEGKDNLVASANAKLDEMKSVDPVFADFIRDAYGYAVYPTVGEGGFIGGAGYGKGDVYERGKMIGWSDITQLSVGAQIGGQKYSEVIAFENKDALNRFIEKEYTLAAEATATAITAGTAAKARWQNGMAVFTYGQKGLMAKAAVGGQRFRFRPVR
jgi:lipid-binding SYLF domain-containing protein